MGIGAGSYGLSAEEFADWCAGVDGALTAKRKASSLLHCFAIPAPIPADTRPVNILVDMQEIAGQFGLGDGDGELEVDDNPTICRPKARLMKSISSELGIDHSLLQTQTAAWMMKQLRKGYAASMQTPRTSLCQGGRNAYLCESGDRFAPQFGHSRVPLDLLKAVCPLSRCRCREGLKTRL
jgi:hypothetical protein